MKKGENSFVVLDLKVYPLKSIYAAAYVFLEKAYFFLEKEKGAKIKVNIRPKSFLSKKDKETMKEDFLNETINFSLRESISKDNRQIREYMIATALANSLGVQDLMGEGNFSDEEDLLIDDEEFTIPWEKKEFNNESDPDGIAIPWELKEKKGKKKKKDEN